MINKIASLFLGTFFLLATPLALWAQADPNPETVPPKYIEVNARVGGVVPGPLEPAPSSSSDSDNDDEDSDSTEDTPTPVSTSLIPEEREMSVALVEGYERITVGELFKVRIHLFEFANNQNITLTYTIVGPDGEVYLQQTETIENKTSETFVKTFFTTGDLIPGQYTLFIVAVADDGETASRSVVFSIEAPKASQLQGMILERTQSHFLPWILAGSSVLLLANLGFFFSLLPSVRFSWGRGVFLVINSLIVAILILLSWLW